MNSFMFLSMGFLSLLGVVTVVVFSMCTLTVILGIRNTHAPECRRCKASLINFQDIHTQCPACPQPIRSARDVRFRGRYRSKKLWIICLLISLPFALMILITAGVFLNFQTLMGIDNQGPAMGIVDAMRMDTDELLETLASRPAGSNGWGELNDRFQKNPPTPEQIKQLSVSIVPGLEAHLSQPIETYRPNFELARSFGTLYRSRGFTDPTIQKIITPLINLPSECPKVEIQNGRLVIRIHTTPHATADHNLVSFSGLKPASVTNSIRIDGLDIPVKNAKGTTHWSTINEIHRIKISDLPKSMTTPGEHTIELDVTNTILPSDIANNTPFKLWPSVITKKSNTITCTFTIKED